MIYCYHWRNLSANFFAIDSEKKMLVKQKTDANNAVYESVISILKDGQTIFKEDAAVKGLFVFDQQLVTHRGASSASFGGYVKNESRMPVVGASVVFNELGYEAVTGSKGYFSIKQMAAGDYTFTISFPGYTPVVQQVSLTAGVAAKLDVTLINAMKNVA